MAMTARDSGVASSSGAGRCGRKRSKRGKMERADCSTGTAAWEVVRAEGRWQVYWIAARAEDSEDVGLNRSSVVVEMVDQVVPLRRISFARTRLFLARRRHSSGFYKRRAVNLVGRERERLESTTMLFAMKYSSIQYPDLFPANP